MPLRVVDHPLSRHYLTILRDEGTSSARFQDASRKLAVILALEATRHLECRRAAVRTPLEQTAGEVLARPLAVVPVLRAGLGLLDAVVGLFPDVAVGYIGLERHHDTAIARSYYCKLPRLDDKDSICLDPMLATGGSASQALSLMKAHGAKNPLLACIVAAPEGVARIEAEHPGVEIVTAALDRGLNEQKYILPGLGDYGDRLYGTL